MSQQHFSGTRDRLTLGDNETIALVNHYLQTYRFKSGKPAIRKILAKLGWNQQQWAKFKYKAGQFLVWDKVEEFSVLVTEETGDPKMVQQSLEKRGIPTEEIKKRVATAYGSLKNDLQALGLTETEVEGALAMQTFGENRFANAMEVVSSGVFKTGVKLQTQQGIIEERLKTVRSQIAEYGTMACEERDNWVSEESKLVRQYAIIGKLLAEIQETWYQGAAQLALVRMRMRDEEKGGAPQGSNMKQVNKPRFRPTVVDADVVQQESAPAGNDIQNVELAGGESE